MAGHVRLAWIFFRIGTTAFGGLGATVALLEEELARRHQLPSRDTIAEALTYTKLLPGSTVVQVVAYLGWRLGGWTGSLVSTGAFLIPSVALMLALAYGYDQLAALPVTAAVRRGVLAAVVGLLLVTMVRLSKGVLVGPFAIALSLGAFAIGAASQAHAAGIVLVAGLLGILSRR